MNVTERIRSTHRGQLLTMAGAATAWVTVYWVNGWLWDTLLYNGFGMAPTDRLTETLHFFLYDTIKIALLLLWQPPRRTRQVWSGPPSSSAGH